MESFVREDLLDLLSDAGITNEHELLKNFFGLYHAKTTKFRFLPGEKVLLKRIAEYIKNIGTDDDASNQFKAPEKYKFSRKGTFRLFGATFYGKKSCDKKQQADDFEQQDAERETAGKLPLCSIFFTIVKQKYESKYPCLIGKEYLKENMINVTKKGNRITGSVQCIFCPIKKNPKVITVQYDEKNNGLYHWNFSNLFKHFGRHTSEKDMDVFIEKLSTENKDPENIYRQQQTSTDNKLRSS